MCYVFDMVCDFNSDYQITPDTSWNYALSISDFDNLEKDVKFVQNSYVSGHAPFNRSNIATEAWVNAVSISDWNIKENAAQSPPTSPVCTNSSVVLDEQDSMKYNDGINDVTCGPVSQIKLVPHGCTDLRIAEFPLAYTVYQNTTQPN